MEKTFYYAKIVILFFIITSCENRNSNLINAKKYTTSIKSISDSLNKLKTYNLDLLICSYSEDSIYGKLLFESPNKPYSIGTAYYDYERVNNIDILFIDYSEVKNLTKTENDKLYNKEKIGDNYYKIEHLVKSGKITFGKKFTNYPFLKFIFCKENISNVNCLDNIMESKAYYEAYESNIEYEEKIFYPNCN
ncbi:hypothetical protein LXD69_02785 [Flavobacterium sediminilitoris]|uniref:Lipoprotein n=1 Tax=Flavobacterium sediminilitoris TaxID=2024526 RepID=A0ABY4HPC3_9FLAO|nr:MULTISPECIES: hypothetical protein [Flavobacterium]UOX34445.1 hypothetical protein LXD69_02785 [Flavobacterium sediminilitoris]